jgi:hypothetical protein
LEKITHGAPLLLGWERFLCLSGVGNPEMANDV